MSGAVEIRHSQQEVTHQVSTCLVNVAITVVVELYWNPTGVSWLPFFVAIALVFVGLLWLSLGKEYIRVDDEGVTVRRGFITRKVLWSQVVSYSADWQPGYNLFGFSGCELQGKIVLKDAAGHKLLTLKIDLGTTEQRSIFRTSIMLRLQRIVSGIIVSEPSVIMPHMMK
jgi:hypothetical protein